VTIRCLQLTSAARAPLSLPVALAAVLLFPDIPFAAEVDIHGFLMGTGSVRAGNIPLKTGEKNNWLLGEERLRINLDIESDGSETGAVAKIDFLNDNVAGSADIEARELYGEYLADSFEIRAGRQMMTWGVADRLFINDVFPKNWTAFFAGQPLEYLKTGSDAIKLSVFGKAWDIELVGIPFAQTDVVPQSDRFVVFDPGFTVQEPDNRLSNGELAARLHTTLGTMDVALYAFRGYWHQPDKGLQGANIIFPHLNNYGLTLQDSILGGVLSLEAGFYQSADDISGTNPFISNSQYRYLIGYEREVVTDVILALSVLWRVHG